MVVIPLDQKSMREIILKIQKAMSSIVRGTSATKGVVVEELLLDQTLNIVHETALIVMHAGAIKIKARYPSRYKINLSV